MKKCPDCKCIWLIYVNENVSLCPYANCVRLIGWEADKKNKNSKNK